MNKKGDFGFEQIAKIILALVVLIIMISITVLYKDKAIELLSRLKDILTFGR